MSTVNAPAAAELAFLPFHVADIGDAEVEAVVQVLRSGWLTTGPVVREFEAEFARAVGAKHAVGLNSATAALHLALDAVGLTPGDEVIVPAMTFAATAEVVRYFQAVPVLVDCDPETLNIRAVDIEPAITARTKAIIPVHMAGLSCDLDPILALARSHNLPVIEDAAHAFPSTYKGRKIGSLSDMTAFSFYATKTLTTGEGGMLTTDNDAYAERARIMGLHGISRHAWNRYTSKGTWRYDILYPGFKYNLTDIAAALGRVQLARSVELWEARQRVAQQYDAAFADIPEVRIPARTAESQHAWHLYPIRLDLQQLRIGRDEVIDRLRAAGIGTSVHFIPLHHHPYYQSTFGYSGREFPNTVGAFESLISLPIYSTLDTSAVHRVVQTLADIIAASRA